MPFSEENSIKKEFAENQYNNHKMKPNPGEKNISGIELIIDK